MQFQEYTCGFLFSEDRQRVLMIEKQNPEWQRNKYNGVGGKLEKGELPLDCMKREFHEEAGTIIEGWVHFATLNSLTYRVYLYRAFGDLEQCKSMTIEQLRICQVNELPSNVVPNIHWLIPLALCEGIINGDYYVDTLVRGVKSPPPMSLLEHIDGKKVDHCDVGAKGIGQEHPR